MKVPILVALLAGAVACSSAPPLGESARPPSPSNRLARPSIVAPSPNRLPRAATDGPIPTKPIPLAGTIRELESDLGRAVEAWARSRFELAARPAFSVQVAALRLQRVYRVLAARPALFSAVVDQLPNHLARKVREHVRANRKLTRLVVPLKKLPGWQLRRPAPPAQLRRYFEAGERRFGIPWEVLAAINLVESRFGRILGPSSAGARGPMQFLPSTWDMYGRGDIDNPHDSIIAAARYLAASGGRDDLRSALYAYNRSYDYVDAIQTFARYMQKDEANYYFYYFWEVFVLTTRGDVQLTGPGGARPYPD